MEENGDFIRTMHKISIICFIIYLSYGAFYFIDIVYQHYIELPKKNRSISVQNESQYTQKAEK